MYQVSLENLENVLRVAFVWANGVKIESSSQALLVELAELVGKRRLGGFPAEARRQAVRGMLRYGGFKPSGRNKPASEYLVQAATEDRFPYICNVVDINNYISLLCGFPVSLLDAEKTGREILIRCGYPGETYVFNISGQEIDLQGLICVCAKRGDNSLALGNPIKDSMAGKVSEETRNILGVVYAPFGVDEQELKDLARLFSSMLARYAGSDDVGFSIV
jgi:DNA/RNA-binding domain of Phe-tRNA-synthetase-like protein